MTQEEYRAAIARCDNDLKSLEGDMKELRVTYDEVRKEKADLILHRASGLHIGDYCAYDVPCGKVRKTSKCLIEYSDGSLWLRPVKQDGTLAARRFRVFRGDEEDLKRWDDNAAG